MEEKNKEVRTYSEYLDKASRHRQSSHSIEHSNRSMKRRPWYRQGWTMLFLGGFVLLAIAYFTSHMIDAINGVSDSIGQQTEALKQQNQTLSIQNEVLRGIIQGFSDIGQQISQLVITIQEAIQKFTS